VNPLPPPISGRTLLDVTGNGISSDDLPLGGVSVQLFVDNNSNAVLDTADTLLATTISNSSTGVYTFSATTPGRYFVQEITPGAYLRTAPDLSSYYTVNVIPGVAANALDFDHFPKDNNAHIKSISFVINGVTSVKDLRKKVHAGDVVEVFFTIPSGDLDTLSVATYAATNPNGDSPQLSRLYQAATGTFGPGVHSLKVVVPNSYFEIDFVTGPPLDHFGPDKSNISYSAQHRLLSSDTGGTQVFVFNVQTLIDGKEKKHLACNILQLLE
jgi:hypothetical protein